MWKKLLLFPNIQITSGPQVLELEPSVTFFDVSLEPSYYLKKETLEETFTLRCNVENREAYFGRRWQSCLVESERRLVGIPTFCRIVTESRPFHERRFVCSVEIKIAKLQELNYIKFERRTL
ncbi:hypothetical protein RHGRI_002372 [Rhododendron griersonianum]|uniref:Uncharacterized protein n=1 Tax=Rhododendron griersonianum TaxID=479676 RepID=A0AAV6LQZ7_9ERIC|nr:hypothetical protein RHGRI_002372 [Rhododendron griersonianum]